MSLFSMVEDRYMPDRSMAPKTRKIKLKDGATMKKINATIGANT